MSTITLPHLDLIAHADHALVRAVDSLEEESYAEASLLPGWTRGHTIAHLALNAEGLARVLTGLRTGEPASMYDPDPSRDEDIAALAASEPAEIRDRLLAGTTVFMRAAEALQEWDADARFERTPGGSTFAVANITLMRVREVEIHHCDLGIGYAPGDWSSEFTTLVLDSMARREHPVPFLARASDLDRTWHYGQGDATSVVTGSSAALGWWLTGRGSGEGLASDSGTLPRIEAW